MTRERTAEDIERGRAVTPRTTRMDELDEMEWVPDVSALPSLPDTVLGVSLPAGPPADVCVGIPVGGSVYSSPASLPSGTASESSHIVLTDIVTGVAIGIPVLLGPAESHSSSEGRRRPDDDSPHEFKRNHDGISDVSVPLGACVSGSFAGN